MQKNQNSGHGIWLIFSKSSTFNTIKPDEALEEALCFGWIDGLITSIDENQYQKKFTPRRKGSKWSEKNKGLTKKLIESGKMTEYGMSAIAQAKRDGSFGSVA